MITQEIVQNALNEGIPALKSLVEKISKDDAIKVLGMLVILGVTFGTINAIKEIVIQK